ncbi:uncharacterized protein LOC127130886 [Lathyrus oleraceus]|uniref:uncharacterized protein LOC127130886 n=1 Tax=Pisum sativum TaxID=3888 RepID=UPI0021D34CC1|nr:uncharacterized protein LOC127130886 [Pisum sativum]
MTDIPTGGVRTLHMEVGIFGFDYDQMIGNEDFMQVFSHEEIGVNVVNTYIRFLYDKLMRPNGLDVSFGFLAPATVNLVLILNRPDTVTEYVLRILMDNKDAEKLFFIPFNTGGHWLLLAINPIREIVYYLDSLGNDWTTYPDMKVLIDTVLQAFRAQRVIQTSRRENYGFFKKSNTFVKDILVFCGALKTEEAIQHLIATRLQNLLKTFIFLTTKRIKDL